MQEDITRRDFLSGLCSKDNVKALCAAFYGFEKEVKQKKLLSCDEAALMLGRKVQMRKNNSLSKGGIK